MLCSDDVSRLMSERSELTVNKIDRLLLSTSTGNEGNIYTRTKTGAEANNSSFGRGRKRNSFRTPNVAAICNSLDSVYAL